MAPMMLTRSLMVTVLVSAALAAPAAAQTSVDKTVPFELDKWYELGVKEGPITLHRIHLERQSGTSFKARVAGADDEYRALIKVELEYSNGSSTDWKAVVRVSWLNEQGEAIDGYNGSSELDEKKDFDRVGGTVVTLKYGLAHARKLRLLINVKPD
jgi:hypothetical protein